MEHGNRNADRGIGYACAAGRRPDTIGTSGCMPIGGTPVASGASINRETSVEEPLKHLMQELGNAINDSLSESDRIAEAIGGIKKAGYDVFLVLEATIGFNRRDESSSDEEPEMEVTEEEPRRGSKPPARSSSPRRTTAFCARSRLRWMTRTADRERSISPALPSRSAQHFPIDVPGFAGRLLPGKEACAFHAAPSQVPPQILFPS